MCTSLQVADVHVPLAQARVAQLSGGARRSGTGKPEMRSHLRQRPSPGGAGLWFLCRCAGRLQVIEEVLPDGPDNGAGWLLHRAEWQPIELSDDGGVYVRTDQARGHVFGHTQRPQAGRKILSAWWRGSRTPIVLKCAQKETARVVDVAAAESGCEKE